MNNVDDGWSMHEYASANVRWSRFAGNHQGFAGIQHSNTKFYNCVFMNNNGAGSMSGDVVLEVNEAGATMSAEFYDCIFDGAVVSNPVQNTGVPTFKAYRCKFFGYNLSNNAQVGDGVIHFGSSTAKTFNVEIDDCDFYQSIMGKRLLLIRGTASTTILNNNRIVDRIKNTQKSTFIENGATSSITNNEFRHLGTAFDNMNGAVVTDNNFIDVDTIGGTGATITNSTSKFKNNDIQVDITGIPNGSHELTLTNEGGRIIYKQQTGFAGGSVLLSTDEQVGTQLYGLVRDTLDPSNKTAPVKAVVS
ncbi:MAG: hypothetical protein COA43_14840 [Robiginitomaculum sp.]|nr:MAG: hypothetical protein COA43_14840 [Robiginitomaculum sp.]